MIRSTQQAEQRRPSETTEAVRQVEAWLRHALAQQYGTVSREPLPDSLLRLLPSE